MYPLWKTLSELKEKKWVELSHLMNNDSPYWGGIPEGAVELGNVVFDWGNPMLECQIQQFKFPGQFGTHIDFSAHFKKGGVFAESFGMKDAVFPLCVVDISAKAAADPHYCVTVEDIKDKSDSLGRVKTYHNDIAGVQGIGGEFSVYRFLSHCSCYGCTVDIQRKTAVIGILLYSFGKRASYQSKTDYAYLHIKNVLSYFIAFM